MLWTLILTLTVYSSYGVSTHTVSVPNISTKEACRAAGQQHVDKHFDKRRAIVAVYTCVEQGKINGL